MLTLQPQVRIAFSIWVGLRGVLGVVKYIDFCADCLGGYEELVERVVPRSVHLPLMVDLLDYLKQISSITSSASATFLASDIRQCMLAFSQLASTSLELFRSGQLLKSSSKRGLE